MLKLLRDCLVPGAKALPAALHPPPTGTRSLPTLRGTALALGVVVNGPLYVYHIVLLYCNKYKCLWIVLIIIDFGSLMMSWQDIVLLVP